MHWKKQGLVFAPDSRQSWMQSHACAPTVIHREDDVFRVFFATRDKGNRSHVGFFDIRLAPPYAVVCVSDAPVLAPGPLGTFDDHGVYASSIVKHQDQYLMYTIGWNPGVRSPLFYSTIGLAVSEDGEHFTRRFKAPVLARSEYDPCLVTGPFVLQDNDKWRMWYVSGYEWTEVNGIPQSHYHIKYAESRDGVTWVRRGEVSIDHADQTETNIGRPCIIKDRGCYRAWYGFACERGYRIGYAESMDGIQFERKDHRAGISVSSEGFDSEMVAHPAIVPFDGKWYMFYNGNQFGKAGVGLAVADSLEA